MMIPANAQPFIGDDEANEKDVHLGETGRFNWTVFRNDSLCYVVSVSVSGFEMWNQQASPSYFVLDDQQDYQIVTVSLDMPAYPEVELRNATISFVFREINSSATSIITKNVTVHVVGIFPAGNENFIFGIIENPFPSPLNIPYVVLIINILIWIGIAGLTYFFIKRFVLAFTQKTKTYFDDILIRIIRKPIILFIVVYGVIASILQLNINIGIRTTIHQVYYFIFVILGMYVSLRAFHEFLDEFSRKKHGKKDTFDTVLKPVFKKIGLIIIATAGMVFALNALGINVTALLAGAGVIGLVIAFAAQDTLSNFFSGMHLLLDRPFRIGEIILLESGEYCRVDNVGMRSTKLYSLFDHELIVLPNNSLANQKIINLVQPDVHIKVKLKIDVAYGSDVKKVMKILYDVAMKNENVVKGAGFEPVIRFSDFADSSLTFNLFVWIDDVMNQWKALSDMRQEIDAIFRKEGIEIPFPQNTVWLHHVDKEETKSEKEQKKS
jgi:small-conductance mechanosensitive channel